MPTIQNIAVNGGTRQSAVPTQASPGDVEAARRKRAFKELETALLSQAFEASLPKSTRLFGSGAAGDLARSQFASQLGRIVAERGTLGIAERLSASGAVTQPPRAASTVK